MRGRSGLGLVLGCAAALAWLAAPPDGAASSGALTGATSPYLLAHADDAIDWRPWGPESLKRARRSEKLIYLSIGYAACHRCHVMARRTYSDGRVIEILNREFVGILVDRQERPDLDNYFMGVMSAMRGRSGSPANFFLTPDLVPLFVAGYLGPVPRYGEPGIIEVARTLAPEWSEKRGEILRSAERIRGELRALKRYAAPTASGSGARDPRAAAARVLVSSYDRLHGGFGTGPKFPRPNVQSFLLRHGVHGGDAAVLASVFGTLYQMAAGAIRDQLGGAFHRYVLDRFWRVPHFEIMLDGSALLARLYLEAYQASGETRYMLVARGILDDLLERFRVPGGGLVSALDAESD